MARRPLLARPDSGNDPPANGRIGSRRFDVFISHSTRSDVDQREIVDGLAQVLKRFGLSVFLDRLSVDPGEDVFSTLEQAIRASSVGVLVMTKNALTSAWVAFEINEMAKLRGRRMKVFGLCLEPSCKPPRALPGLDVIRPRSRHDFMGMARPILQALSKTVALDGPHEV